MGSVAPNPIQRQIRMSLSAQDRVRQSVVHKVAPDVILARYRAMKGVATAQLEDISAAVMAVLVAEVLAFLSPESLTESIVACNRVQAHSFAIADDENERIAQRARQDIEQYGDLILAKFMRTSPKLCPLCMEALITNAVDVLLTDSGHITGRAHGLCCAKDERRFEYVSDFTYRLVPRG